MIAYSIYTKIYAKPHFFKNRGRRKQGVTVNRPWFYGGIQMYIVTDSNHQQEIPTMKSLDK